MNKVDWYAYLDGTLSADERVIADQTLAEDANAKGQLNEVREFLASIRREGLSEEVPLSRLQAMVPKQAKVSFPQLAWKPALAAGILMAAIGIARVDRRPAYEALAAKSFTEAAAWIEDRNGIKLARLPQNIGRIIESERTPDSGCFCIQIDGKIVHLRYTKDEAKINGLIAQVGSNDGFMSGNGRVAFRADNLVWIVDGKDSDSVWRVAREASKQLRV